MGENKSNGPNTATAVLYAVLSDGTLNPLQGYVRLKELEKEVADAIARLKGPATEEAAKYGKGEHSAYGATIKVAPTPGKWTYEGLPWYDQLKQHADSIALTIKSKAAMAQAAYRAKEALKPLPVDAETGEEIQPAIYVAGVDQVSISLPKQQSNGPIPTNE